MNNPYLLLGISPSASAEQITAAYRARAHEAHPDRNGGSAESTAQMAAINAAYDALKTAAARAAVDARLAAEAARTEDPKKLAKDLFVQSWIRLENPHGYSDPEKLTALAGIVTSSYDIFGSPLYTLCQSIQTLWRPAPPPTRRRKKRAARA